MYHIIINPVAGKGKTMRFLPPLTKLFAENNLPIKTHITQKIMDGYYIAKTLCKTENCNGIIGIGGDGTLQEVAAGMIAAREGDIYKSIPFGAFSAGSGNDFAMSLEGSKSAAIKIRKKPIETVSRAFFEKILCKKTRTIDIITANGMAYLNIANMGIDARIVKNAVSLKQKFGRHAYLAAVYKSIVQHENLNLKITADGKNLDGLYTLVAICNGRYYGGGMQICPSAKIDDGKITLCLVDALSRPKTMAIFPTVLMNKHTHLKEVRMIECEEVIITPMKLETLCMDGNLSPVENPIYFKILSKALEVFI